MKKLSYLITMVILAVFLFGNNLSAQEEGTFIDNASPQDSSYIEGDALDFESYYEDDSSGNWAIYIGAAVVIVGGALVFLRKKKKK